MAGRPTNTVVGIPGFFHVAAIGLPARIPPSRLDLQTRDGWMRTGDIAVIDPDNNTPHRSSQGCHQVRG
jgi:hypothetical protein